MGRGERAALRVLGIGVREVVRLDMFDRRATCTCGWSGWGFSPYLDHAASNLAGKFEVGGSNVRATVVKLLRDVAFALRAAHTSTDLDHTNGRSER